MNAEARGRALSEGYIRPVRRILSRNLGTANFPLVFVHVGRDLIR